MRAREVRGANGGGVDDYDAGVHFDRDDESDDFGADVNGVDESVHAYDDCDGDDYDVYCDIFVMFANGYD